MSSGSDVAPGEGQEADATRIVAGTPQDLDESSTETLPRGTTVSRYVVLERLGGGGMGVVYKAYDPELARVVAIKLLRPERTSDEASSREMGRRLQREAQALAQVSDPNVIAVHDVGTWNQHVFIAMELVQGVTLGAWLKASERSLDAIIQAFLAAGQGLSAAHRAGIVHRDFKPSNVIVAEDGRVRVLDFGLARGAEGPATGQHATLDGHPSGTEPPDGNGEAAASSPEPSTNTGFEVSSARLPAPDSGFFDGPPSQSFSLVDPLTVAGTVMGTPGYMAPEQQRGFPTDARTDQFSFAVALYEALAGTRPFSKGAFRIGSPRPPPPSFKKIPVKIRRSLARALEENPDSRFPTMDALLNELRRAVRRRQRPWLVLAAALVVATPVTLMMANPRTPPCQGSRTQIETLWGPIARKKVADAFAATGRTHAAELFGKFSATVDTFVDRWAAAHQDACEATHVLHEQSEAMLDTRMACLKRERHKLKSLVTLLESSTETSTFDKATLALIKLDNIDSCSRVDELLAANPLPSDPEQREVVVGLLNDLDRSHVMQEAGKFNQALDLARDVVKQSDILDHPPLRALALFRQGVLQVAVGKWKEGEETLKESLRWSASSHDEMLQAETWITLMGAIGVKQSRYDEAEHLHLAAEMALLASAQPPRLRQRLLTVKATIAKDRGDLDSALSVLEEAISVVPQGSSVSVEELEALNMLGIVLTHKGDLTRAAEVLRRVAELQEQYLGAHHPHVSVPLANLALVEHRRGNHEEAENIFRRVVAIDEATFGSEHPWICEDLNNLGKILIARRRYDEAAETLERGLSIAERTVGAEHLITGALLLNLGSLSLERGHYEQAQAYFERALPILDAVGINLLPELHMQWGRLHSARGDYGAARQAFSAAHKRHAAAGSLDTVAAGELFWQQGKTELAADEPAQAIEAFETAIRLWKQDQGAEFTSQLVRARLMLAQTLWRSGERSRAVEVAVAAKGDLASADTERYTQERASVDDWLATHALPAVGEPEP